MLLPCFPKWHGGLGNNYLLAFMLTPRSPPQIRWWVQNIVRSRSTYAVVSPSVRGGIRALWLTLPDRSLTLHRCGSGPKYSVDGLRYALGSLLAVVPRLCHSCRSVSPSAQRDVTHVPDSCSALLSCAVMDVKAVIPNQTVSR